MLISCSYKPRLGSAGASQAIFWRRVVGGRIEKCFALALFGLMGALKLFLPVALAGDTVPALSAHYPAA
jgi:hypothetical protein